MKNLKVKVYIDGANMFYTQKKLGWFFDWQKIKESLGKNYKIEEIRFYIGKKAKDEKMESFLKVLRKIGFEIITKAVKKIKTRDNQNGEEKANFDVEMTRDILLDILWFKKKWEGLVFFTGDSDFEPLVKDLKRIFHKSVYVFSSRTTLAWELKMAVSQYFFMEDFKKEFFRQNWHLTKERENGIKNHLTELTPQGVRFLIKGSSNRRSR